MINLRIAADLVDLLLDDAQSLEVLRVLPVVANQLADVLVCFL